MIRMPRVSFYTKSECHLCDEAMEVVLDVRRKIDFELEIIDIESDSALHQEYGEKIPMIFINDRPAFKFRVDMKSLERKLKEFSAS